MSKYQEVKSIVDGAKHIVVLQADNPDGDSLGTSLALEAILTELGKNVTLVCSVDIPSYMHYLEGWSRVQKEVPTNFDATIIVDTSTETLFEKLASSESFGWIKTKPVIVLDHHAETSGISFATVTVNETAVATSEVVYRIAIESGWELPFDACEMLAVAIMSDSLGLVSDATTAESMRIMADLIERGVSLAKLDQARRELMRKEPELLPYKGQLLSRIKYDETGRIAIVTIPWKEIEQYSPLYNPSMLVLDDMRMVTGVDVAIAYKYYDNGRITAKIRCNFGKGIAGELASDFGGGGHAYASGFRISDGTKLDDLIKSVNIKANELLDKIGA